MAEYKHWKNVVGDEDACFVTTSIEQFKPVFCTSANCAMLLSALDFYRVKYGFLIHAYVVMPDHLHILIRLQGRIALTKLMADFKRYTAKQILQWCREEERHDLLSVFAASGAADQEAFSVWQRSFRSVPVFSARDALIKAKYIHNNPVRRELVVNAEDWPYSSAAAYAGGHSVIGVDFIEA